MAVYGLWHGGPNYSVPYVDDDAEAFPSIASAGAELLSRERNADGSTPCVQDSEMQVFLTDPREMRDPYPDFILTIGPRGGLRQERV